MARFEKDEPVYMISIAARLCEVHPQTLRLYERLGLIKPYRVGRKNRMYSEADIERLRQIQRLTGDLGVNLAGVEVILSLLEQIQDLQHQLDTKLEKIQAMTRRIRELEE